MKTQYARLSLLRSNGNKSQKKRLNTKNLYPKFLREITEVFGVNIFLFNLLQGSELDKKVIDLCSKLCFVPITRENH